MIRNQSLYNIQLKDNVNLFFSFSTNSDISKYSRFYLNNIGTIRIFLRKGNSETNSLTECVKHINIDDYDEIELYKDCRIELTNTDAENTFFYKNIFNDCIENFESENNSYIKIGNTLENENLFNFINTINNYLTQNLETDLEELNRPIYSDEDEENILTLEKYIIENDIDRNYIPKKNILYLCLLIY